MNENYNEESLTGLSNITPCWDEVSNKASKNNDPTAQALLDLKSKGEKNLLQTKKDVEAKLSKLKDEERRFEESLKIYKSDLNRVNNFIVAVLLFVSITFIATTLSLFWSGILSNNDEREIYSKFNEMHQNYLKENSELKSVINAQKMEVNDLKNEIKILKAKNSYLK